MCRSCCGVGVRWVGDVGSNSCHFRCPGKNPHPPKALTPNPSPGARERGDGRGAWADAFGIPRLEGSSPAAPHPPPKAPLPRTGRGVGVRVLWEWGKGSGGGLTFLIVAPRIQIPRKTASLFAALQPGDFSDGSRVQQQADRLRAGLPLDPGLLGNAFSRALYALRPDVEAVASAMREAGAEHVALSGAGPAHYAAVR